MENFAPVRDLAEWFLFKLLKYLRWRFVLSHNLEPECIRLQKNQARRRLFFLDSIPRASSSKTTRLQFALTPRMGIGLNLTCRRLSFGPTAA